MRAHENKEIPHTSINHFWNFIKKTREHVINGLHILYAYNSVLKKPALILCHCLISTTSLLLSFLCYFSSKAPQIWRICVISQCQTAVLGSRLTEARWSFPTKWGFNNFVDFNTIEYFACVLLYLLCSYLNCNLTLSVNICYFFVTQRIILNTNLHIYISLICL